MLCMTRNWGERIRIVCDDQTLTIQVDKSDDDRVVLAIAGPGDFWTIQTMDWGEAIIIRNQGRTMSVQVNESHKGDRAQLAIDGPQDFRIVRDELRDIPARRAGAGQ